MDRDTLIDFTGIANAELSKRIEALEADNARLRQHFNDILSLGSELLPHINDTPSVSALTWIVAQCAKALNTPMSTRKDSHGQ